MKSFLRLLKVGHLVLILFLISCSTSRGVREERPVLNGLGGLLERSETACNPLIPIHEDEQSSLLLNRGIERQKKGLFEKARRDFVDYSRREGKFCEGYVLTAQSQSLLGDQESAVETIAEAARVAGNADPIFQDDSAGRLIRKIQKGKVNAQLGLFEILPHCTVDREETSSRCPRDVSLVFRVIAATIDYEIGNTEKAIYGVNSILRESDEEWSQTQWVREALRIRGNSWLKKGKPEYAIPDYLEYILLDKTNAKVYANLATAYSRMRKDTEALGYYTTALEIDTTLRSAWIGKGIIYLNMDSYGDAQAQFDSAFLLSPPRAAELTWRGLARMKHGDCVGAREDARRALLIDPDHTAASGLLERCQ